jgi:hypothetical protein
MSTDKKLLKTACRGAAVTMLAYSPAAVGLPPADPQSIITLDVENDSILQNSDKYYTGGERLAYTSPTDAVPAPLMNLDNRIWGEGRQRISVDLQQLLFTPSETQIKPPNPADRPYAAVLTVDANLIHDTDTARSTLGIGLGITGPAALGEEVQNGFHHLIGDTTNKGWSYQLPTQPVVQLLAERVWRLPLAEVAVPAVGPIEFDTLPELTLNLGTFRTYAQAGVEFRVGQGLRSDFGAPRERPGMTGGDAYVTVRPVAWYLFAGADGQAVGYDATIQGDFIRNSRHVTADPAVGELTAGAAVMAYGVRLAFVHVSQTPEFKGQLSGFFNFDGIVVSAKF